MNTMNMHLRNHLRCAISFAALLPDASAWEQEVPGVRTGQRPVLEAAGLTFTLKGGL